MEERGARHVSCTVAGVGATPVRGPNAPAELRVATVPNKYPYLHFALARGAAAARRGAMNYFNLTRRGAAPRREINPG